MIRLNGRNCRAGVGQWDRRNRFCLSTYNKQCCIMSKQRNIDLSGNNSTQQPTAQPSEMGKYSTLELQAAFVHLFETKVENEKSWILVKEQADGSTSLYSISDSINILRLLEKKKGDS